jgi:predicted RNA polymerase sigma factor/8-oxo-dGTP pyrophosphatase MutT (NUDIX family)
MPDNPRGWLVAVASRRLIDQVRSDHARRERESAMAAEVAAGDVPGTDDTLVLLFLCCHPALTAASQAALTLRAVGGLTTAEIARAFLVPEATMAARISRAKQRIRAAGSSFRLPGGAELAERLPVVLHVLYLIFNEGYTASAGSELHRTDLAREAIRLARMVHAQLPGDSEVTGLLALMLLTHARQQARTTAAGDLVPLDEQDRAQWDRALIDEGTELAKASLAGPALGPYQLQAAIAATHADAATAPETNWRQVHALYLILERIAPNPMVTLNRAIALAETEGPQAGLALLSALDGDQRMARHHRLLSVRAHLLEKTGEVTAACDLYRRAARSTASIAEQRYLQARASRLRSGPVSPLSAGRRPGILAGMRWTVHSETPLYTDEWLDIRLADIELPDGRRLEHRLIRTPAGAGCVAVRDGCVLLLWRHRFITDTWGWEIPLGRVDPGEDPAAAAARETEEETGWRPGRLTPLLRVQPTPGISDSEHHVYLADSAQRTGPPQDDFESERVSWVPLAGVPELIGRGDISSGTTLAALLYAMACMPVVKLSGQA